MIHTHTHRASHRPCLLSNMMMTVRFFPLFYFNVIFGFEHPSGFSDIRSLYLSITQFINELGFFCSLFLFFFARPDNVRPSFLPRFQFHFCCYCCCWCCCWWYYWWWWWWCKRCLISIMMTVSIIVGVCVCVCVWRGLFIHASLLANGFWCVWFGWNRIHKVRKKIIASHVLRPKWFRWNEKSIPWISCVWFIHKIHLLGRRKEAFTILILLTNVNALSSHPPKAW